MSGAVQSYMQAVVIVCDLELAKVRVIRDTSSESHAQNSSLVFYRDCGFKRFVRRNLC